MYSCSSRCFNIEISDENENTRDLTYNKYASQLTNFLTLNDFLAQFYNSAISQHYAQLIDEEKKAKTRVFSLAKTLSLQPYCCNNILVRPLTASNSSFLLCIVTVNQITLLLSHNSLPAFIVFIYLSKLT